MKNNRTNTMERTVMGSLVALTVTGGVALAETSEMESIRKGRFEAGPTFLYLHAETIDARAGGSSVVVDSDPTFGGGLSVGYHLTEHFALSADLLAGGVGGTAYLNNGGKAPVQGDFDATGFTGLFNGEWNILKSRFTPVVGGTIGFMTSDAERVSGVSSTELVYGLAAGARWDINDRWAVKALFRALWGEVDLGSYGTPSVGGYGFTLHAAYKF